MQSKTRKIEQSVKKTFKEVFGNNSRFINIVNAGTNGVSDLVICAGGFHFEIEIKAENDVLTDVQIVNLLECNKAGGFGFVITEKDVKALEAILTLIMAFEYDITDHINNALTYPPAGFDSLLTHCKVSF